jgi:hypothetical protein
MVVALRPQDYHQEPGSSNGRSVVKGQKSRKDTHASTTTPEAKLVRKGPGKDV